MRKRRFPIFFVFALSLLSFQSENTQAQVGISEDSTRSGGGLGLQSRGNILPERPLTYEIGGITITGPQYLDDDLLLAVTGLKVGDPLRIPHDEKIAQAIRNLWKQELFADVQVEISRQVGKHVFLNIILEERPRLSKYHFVGIRKSEAEELRDKLSLVRSRVVTEATKQEALYRIRRYFREKGFFQVKVDVQEHRDSLGVNMVVLRFLVDKGPKGRINQVHIIGNENLSDIRLKRAMRGTKEMPRISLYPADRQSVYSSRETSFGRYLAKGHFLSLSKTMNALNPYLRLNIFSSSKFNEQKFEKDKQAIVELYNAQGYRDAAVVRDTLYLLPNGNLNLDLEVREGRKYYFGDIEWKGNTKYSDEYLSQVLGIERGQVYDQALLDARTGRMLSPEGGQDISSLYMDDGYLFFNIDVVESAIEGDTIHYEMRITEGQQATNRFIAIKGNNRTNEHVIRRELRTLPGNKFSRADLIRSNREIANLGFFDQEKIGIQPRPNPEDGTVDIEYTVVEKSSDQLQLSAGFGGGVRFYGNIGVIFNNFSIRNIFKPQFWDPLPVGDGQRLSLNYQSNGAYYNSLNFSFTEPWLGGKKPNALTTNFIYSRFSGVPYGTFSADSSYISVIGGGLQLSKRVKWPDDNFIFTYGVNYQSYKLKDYGLLENFRNGYSNNLFFKLVLARYSVDQPLYPRSGSNINFSFQFTPPYSLVTGENFKGETNANKYKWIEYHKYRFTAEWYKRISGDLVFKLATKYGFMGYYNPDIGFSPFERFQLGGDGLSGRNFFIGKDIIAHRGYKNPYADNAVIFNKYTAEVRYPFSLSPTSTIYGLAFVEAANAWYNYEQYNPFRLNRSAGLGVRIFLPMFGLLGLDYGLGFDQYYPGAKFSDMAAFTFMLGFEPD